MNNKLDPNTLTDQLIFKKATKEDYSAVVSLQNENLAGTISDAEKRDGYVSVAWNEEQIESANKDIAVVVCKYDSGIAGYVIATTNNFNLRFPLLKHMMSLYATTMFMGHPLSEYRSFIYGPVCVARTFRGTGVLEGLFHELLQLSEIITCYDTGVAFIEKNNRRSIQAHTRNLGMKKLRSFTFGEKEFHIFAFPVSRKSRPEELKY